MDRQEILDHIRREYRVPGERLWLAYPDYVVFRNPRNKKWFAILMDVEKRKLGLEGEGKIDVMNLKCDPILVGSLLQGRGYRPAFHMNKTNWVTVLLDSAPPEEIQELLRISYDTVDRK